MKKILIVFAFVAYCFALTSCKGKSDADLKTAVETALQANPDLSAIAVDVKDGVATLSGEVKDPATQAAAETTAKSVSGIKSVENLTTPAPPPPAPVTVTADDPLTTAVADALKDHPTVSATVVDGVVTLSGEIEKSDLKTLMQKVQATKPKKVDSQGLTVK